MADDAAPLPAVHLVAATPDDLQRMARGEPPAWRGGPVLPGALAPPFVAERSLRQAAQGVPEAWYCPFHIVRRQDQALVGGCGFKHAPQAGWVEIGYGIASACRNLGFARQAVQALLLRAFAAPDVQGVWAAVSADNLPSTRVVQALGFTPEGLFDDASGETLMRWAHPVPPGGFPSAPGRRGPGSI
jgi:RimJ/RimL family protein N-acetyltransferase